MEEFKGSRIRDLFSLPRTSEACDRQLGFWCEERGGQSSLPALGGRLEGGTVWWKGQEPRIVCLRWHLPHREATCLQPRIGGLSGCP